MTQLILERVFEPPITIADVHAAARAGGWCLNMYRVGWNGSFLSAGGRQLVCSLTAPDAESARRAFRTAGADTRRLWAASVHEARAHEVPTVVTPNVLVERSFTSPALFEKVHALEEAKGWCLEQHRVRWVRSYLSSDGRRMLCLYQAPDAESVRLAQHEAGLAFDTLWPFAQTGPEAMSTA